MICYLVLFTFIVLTNCQSPYFIFVLFTLLTAYLLNTCTHTLLIRFTTFTPSLLSSAQHSITMLIPSLPSFSPLQTQEYPKDKKQIDVLGRLGLCQADVTFYLIDT